MTLGQILSNLNATADDLCIVARRPWSGAADAMLVRSDDDRLLGDLKAAGYEYLLEIDVIKREVLGEWDFLLDSAQRFAVVLHYAEYDAWPEWFHMLCRDGDRV
jgi:hypothetical protein